MGITYARGSITGKTETREYDFLVDTGATWVGIPQADIDALALDTVPNASAALMTADGRVVNTPIYVGIGMLEGTGFVNGVAPAAVPRVPAGGLLSNVNSRVSVSMLPSSKVTDRRNV